MAVIKPPITGDETVDSWTFNTTQRIEDIDAILASLNIYSWVIEEDENGKLIFIKDNVTKMRLDADGNLEIAGTVTPSVSF